MASSLSAGTTLSGKNSQEILDSITHRVGVVLEVRNHTKYPMVQPITFVDAGKIQLQAGDIQAGTREVMSMHKTDHTATGSCGVVSWKLDGLGKRIVLMWSAPYSFDFHANWLAIGTMEDQYANLISPQTFNEMYKGTESWFRRKEFYK
ncbi:hypothetical protein RvY_01656-2 [Ramazzottius varieornatus]|nr:hypothetical protein RvY_01656-2 [Ramazzottius varieornatus]